MAEVENLGYDVSGQGSRRAAAMLGVLTVCFSVLAVAMMVAAAAGMAHIFLLLVLERRHELALMRAVGATRSDLRTMILTEAAVIGLVAGSLGLMAGWWATAVTDRVAGRVLGEWGLEATSLFHLPWWLVVGAIALATMAGLCGALVPAARASTVEPAEALSQR
jgi:ABC-type antimicrobial peptide transport system permease subunit